MKKILSFIFIILFVGTNVCFATYKGVETKRIVVDLQDGISTALVGNWFIENAGTTTDVNAGTCVPDDFGALVEAYFIIIPDATETIQWDIDTSVSAIGELYNADDRGADNLTQAVTVSVHTKVPVTDYLSGLAKGDCFTVYFQSDTDFIRVWQFVFVYTTKP